jgi:hypothetical protein
MRLLDPKRLVRTLALAILAGALSEILQRWLVEPALPGELSAVVELSPLYPTIAVALLAGCYSHRPMDGLVHSAVLAAGDVVVGVVASWLLGYDYAQDMKVGDPGFLQFISIQFLVLLLCVAVLAQVALLARTAVRTRSPRA